MCVLVIRQCFSWHKHAHTITGQSDGLWTVRRRTVRPSKRDLTELGEMNRLSQYSGPFICSRWTIERSLSGEVHTWINKKPNDSICSGDLWPARWTNASTLVYQLTICACLSFPLQSASSFRSLCPSRRIHGTSSLFYGFFGRDKLFIDIVNDVIERMSSDWTLAQLNERYFGHVVHCWSFIVTSSARSVHAMTSSVSILVLDAFRCDTYVTNAVIAYWLPADLEFRSHWLYRSD